MVMVIAVGQSSVTNTQPLFKHQHIVIVISRCSGYFTYRIQRQVTWV